MLIFNARKVVIIVKVRKKVQKKSSKKKFKKSLKKVRKKVQKRIIKIYKLLEGREGGPGWGGWRIVITISFSSEPTGE
jgi:hypothetical protein